MRGLAKASSAGSISATGPHRAPQLALGALAMALAMLLGASSAQAAAPIVTINPASPTYTGAQVSGTIDPTGDPGTYYSFETSLDGTNWSYFQFQGPVAEANAGPQPISGEVGGFQPGHQYFVRLAALNTSEYQEYFSPPVSFTTVAAPTVDAVTPSTFGAHFVGTVTPVSGTTEYHFEISADAGSHWESFGAASTASTVPITVEADRGELIAGTPYQVRIVATSAGTSASSNPRTFTTSVQAPVARAIMGSGRTTSEVRLNGTVNPSGLPTTYRFEYGTDTSYGSVIPASGPDLYGGSGGTMVRYSKLIGGLAPNTTIHYRVVAHNAEGTSVSADQTVTTLAQEESYEMVSPPQKNAANLLPAYRVRAAATGNRAIYSSAGIFAGGTGALATSRYLSVRGSDNWSTTFLQLPQTIDDIGGAVPLSAFNGFTPDFTHGFVFSNQALRPGAVAGNSNLYLKDFDTGELEFIATNSSSTYGYTAYREVYAGASADSKRIFLYLPTEPETGNVENTQIFELSDGELNLISRLPDNSPVDAGLLSTGSNFPAGVHGEKELNQVSLDGSRVFFTAAAAGARGLYVRENGESTRLITASQRTGADPNAPVNPEEVWMSADGSTAYFTYQMSPGTAPLTNDAPVFTHEGFTYQLYRYDLETGLLSYIAPEGSTGPSDTAFVRSILGVSKDGSTVYFNGGPFQSNGSSGPNGTPSTRLFVNRDGVTRFIDEADLAAQKENNYRGVGGGAVSPNGNYLSFTSEGESFASPRARACDGCKEVYLYDYESNKLSCASCNPSGAVTGAAVLPGQNEWVGLGGSIVRTTLDDGTVFFESSDSLLPEDTNEFQDVYRWANDQLDLVSTGQGAEDSIFGDSTPDGKNVYFMTGQRLVNQDTDSIRDVYVKRAGGGLPAQNRPPADAPCFGEGCLGKSPDPPGEIAPASNGFSGPKNPKPSFHKPRKARKCTKARGHKAQRSKAKAHCAKRSAHRANGGGK